MQSDLLLRGKKKLRFGAAVVTRDYGEPGASQVALVLKNPPANARDIGDVGLIPGLGRSPEGGNGNLLQNSCLGNPVNRGAWQATVHAVTKSQTRLSDGACRVLLTVEIHHRCQALYG